MHAVMIYTRPGCHLCARARGVIARCQQKVNFTIEEVDISQNPELFVRYRNDIPVILLDGKEVARHVVSPRSADESRLKIF
jgi:glutaredoxin